MSKNEDLPNATETNTTGLGRRALGIGALSLAGLAVLAGCSMAAPEATLVATPASSSAGSASPDTTAPETSFSDEEQDELDQRLIRAAKDNDVELVRELIAAGGDVNAKDYLEDSAFLYAGAEGFNEILELTLENGADVFPAPEGPVMTTRSAGYSVSSSTASSGCALARTDRRALRSWKTGWPGDGSPRKET